MSEPFIRFNIKKHFNREDVDTVYNLLLRYEEQPRPDFTYEKILGLSRGNFDSLNHWIDKAITSKTAVDVAFRNLLAWQNSFDDYNSDRWHDGWSHLSKAKELVQKMLETDYVYEFRGRQSHAALIITYHPSDIEFHHFLTVYTSNQSHTFCECIGLDADPDSSVIAPYESGFSKLCFEMDEFLKAPESWHITMDCNGAGPG